MCKKEERLQFIPCIITKITNVGPYDIYFKNLKIYKTFRSKNSCDLGLGKDFLDTKTWFIKEQITKTFKSVSSASWKNAVKTMKS